MKLESKLQSCVEQMSEHVCYFQSVKTVWSLNNKEFGVYSYRIFWTYLGPMPSMVWWSKYTWIFWSTQKKPLFFKI